MTRLLRRRSATRGEDGSALIVALVVVVAVGIMMAAVLDFAGTSISSGIQIRDLRNTNYYAEGAVDGAINQVRGSSKSTCSDYVPPAPPVSIQGATGHSYKVTCSMTSSGNSGIEQPSNAVLTLSTASGEGFIATGNHSLEIDGGLYSRNEVSMQHKTMTINGSLYADGACSPKSPADGGGNVTSTDIATMKCNANGSTDPDPNYKAVAETTTELNTMITSYDADPTPTCANGVVTFKPGLYTQLPGILVQNYAAPACTSGHVWWFKPGPYFFDFSGTWNIGNPCPGSLPCAYDVVGGEPTAPSPAATDPLGYTDWVNGSGTPEDDWGHINPLTDATYPACKDDVTSTAYDGVQFEFGGASNVAIGSQGGIELCGPTNASDQTSIVRSQSDGSTQHIVLDTLKTGSTAALPTSGTYTANNAPTTTGTWTLVPDASVAQNPDGASATAVLTGGSSSATLSYGGPWSDPKTPTPHTPFPKGAQISSASIRVYWTKVLSPTVKVLFTPEHPGAATQSTTISNCASSTDPNFPAASPYCDVTVPLASLNDPDWKDLTEGTIQVQGTGSGTVNVDAVALVANYAPVNADANTCTLANDIANSPICHTPFWDSHVNLNVHLHGTTYVPADEMDVEVQGSGSTIFDRGVIAATLHVTINASSTQTQSPFELPAATPNGRKALFTGYVDSDIRVRACVEFQDFDLLPDNKTKQAFPGYKVQVKSWNVFHAAPTGTPTC